jgi:hypothetical protein
MGHDGVETHGKGLPATFVARATGSSTGAVERMLIAPQPELIDTG